MKTMDKILLAMAISLFIFTIAMLVLFVLYQSIPDTLCTCFFAAFGAEGGFMAIIKTAKTMANKQTTEEDSE